MLLLPEETPAEPESEGNRSRAARLWETIGSRLLFFVSVAVLAVGSVVLLVTLLREPDPKGPLPTAQPTVTTENRTTADIDPAARRVAGEFILTAVARKNVAKSWDLVHPSMKAGFTKAEWATGSIPVQPYPVDNIDEARFSVVHISAKLIQLDVALLPKDESETAGVFTIGLAAVGSGKAKHWLVDYWGPAGAPGFRSEAR